MSMTLFTKGLKEGIRGFGKKVSSLVNFFLLSIVYILSVSLTSIVAKLFGKRFLETKISRDKKTYWHELDLKKKSLKEHYRQF